ncbi:hypothetical protein A2767_01055 [Candidatus Roizmanbacteria bacterium RIFCSPHIGHO2_01_FULL_35_10]|uniref:PIN domain-containing protein n=1 Tax=Candidatus Roizmanbacteria bacterium RIFCSPLOWO2_01_FULL_35_13 TaxID=1802055 RepID=A0A1F7IDQ7_9BACT|nr:MAG: hypothetical protein A2767_01055 [Candidatus Roizmanbacteria bacterium RIFCSPHIGHO2_01_FULL_35_10]OGK41485.1 MAG: hypothetical protein A3A74_05555 [Candidatus Roizmanbacteria bacterium RIFCSPLOWO2_01_FULL_35_13]
MIRSVIIDTNIILRYLRQDHPTLSPKAKELFVQAQKGKFSIYFDEIVIVETVGVLKTYYKLPKNTIVEKISKLLYLTWMVNPRKKLIGKALNLYFNSSKLSYTDCWLFVLSQEEKIQLETFDNNLQKLMIDSRK